MNLLDLALLGGLLMVLLYLVIIVWSFEHQSARKVNNELIDAVERFLSEDEVGTVQQLHQLMMAIAGATGSLRGTFRPKIGTWKKWPRIKP